MSSGQQILRAWYWTAIAVSIVFVLVIPLRWYFPEFLPYLLKRMNLGVENHLGAWWSGVLLFMLACHSIDAGNAALDRNPRLTRAWMIIAGTLLFFSADEIGSLHERLSLLGAWMGIGGWTVLLLLGAVIGAFLIRAFYIIWHSDDEDRKYVLLLIVGFGLLGSVAVQEFVEHSVEWGSGYIIWVRLVLEEGTELLGMIVLLHVIVKPSMKIVTSEQIEDRRIFVALSDNPQILFKILFLLIPVFTIAATLISDHQGALSDWLTIISFVSAGLFVFSRVIIGATVLHRRYTVLAGLCIVASLVPMYSGNTKFWSIYNLEVNKEILAMTLTCLLIYGAWFWTFQKRSTKMLIMMSAYLLVTITAPILSSSQILLLVAPQLLAVLTFGITHALVRDADLPPRTTPTGGRRRFPGQVGIA